MISEIIDKKRHTNMKDKGVKRTEITEKKSQIKSSYRLLQMLYIFSCAAESKKIVKQVQIWTWTGQVIRRERPRKNWRAIMVKEIKERKICK